jgi:hypothetical protein
MTITKRRGDGPMLTVTPAIGRIDGPITIRVGRVPPGRTFLRETLGVASEIVLLAPMGGQ